MLAGCARERPAERKALGPASRYPEPRFPAGLKPPKSVEDVMPGARVLAQAKKGFEGIGFGALEAGEMVALITTADAEDMVVEAIRRALQERGVTAEILPDYKLVGVSREDALAVRKAITWTGELGYMEESWWIDTQFPRPEEAKKWLKERRPDLYAKLFPPEKELSGRLLEAKKKLELESIGKAIRDYLEKHPKVKGVFWGKAGGTSLLRAVHPLERKLLGLFTADNRWEAMGDMNSFPGDVWQLIEEKTMEPVAYVERIEATDPEGTNVWSDLTADMAERWAKGVYQRGHLYMFPNQATGRFGYSVVDYPAFQREWLPREPMTMINGVIAGTCGHGGFYPHWETHYKDGYLADVKGGGIYGEVLREFLKYPRINDATYPYHNHPGYFYLYEIAFGTHPKFFRNPAYLEAGGFSLTGGLTLGPERMRSGVIHWGLGLRLIHDPSGPTTSKSWLAFTSQYNLPMEHDFHTHTYFTTYKVRLRGAGKWLTLMDRGHLTSLDDPEVRALASRYGSPPSLLTEEWIPEIPGINAPGRYADYAADPWKTTKAVMDNVTAGTYEHFYTPRKSSR